MVNIIFTRACPDKLINVIANQWSMSVLEFTTRLWKESTKAPDDYRRILNDHAFGVDALPGYVRDFKERHGLELTNYAFDNVIRFKNPTFEPFLGTLESILTIQDK